MVPGRTLALVCAAALVSSGLILMFYADREPEEYSLSVRVDETKISIVSGNFTLAVTHDEWPRLMFWHTVDPFSPTFDVSFPKLFLFNDTDMDGRFCRSEAVYTVYLDASRVEWNLSYVESGVTAELGEYVSFSMRTVADAYNQTLDTPPCVESWANVTFWFRLSENDFVYENPAGYHHVTGRTELLVNMTVDVKNRTVFDALAIERSLQGGGSARMFHVLEDGPSAEATAVLSGRVDETILGENFTRPLNDTDSPVQCIDTAQEDGTDLAFYRWGSEATDLSGGVPITVNSSCLTTGTGLVLHSVLPLSNGTISFSLDSSAGIDEGGFVGGVIEWMRELGLALAIAGIVAAAAVVIGLHLVLRRRRLRRERVGREKPEGPG